MKFFKAAIGVYLLVQTACTHGNHQNPMRDTLIPVAKRLVIGIFNRGSALDRTALEACVRDNPTLELQDDIYVHRAARDLGMTVDQLISLPNRFDSYERIPGFALLLFAYRQGGVDYLKTVNYLGRYVTNVEMDISRPDCGDIFRGQRLVFFDSHPPLADLVLDDRPIGEAPLWVWLRDGNYRVQCKLPGERFKPIKVWVPKTASVLCQREETTSVGDIKEDEKMSGEEKAGSVLIYLLGAAGTAAAIILPILLLL